MKRDVKTCVIPFSKLEKAAYEYCRRDNHISDETSKKRREKFELQAEQVWDKIKHAKIQVDLVFLEEEKAGETVFQREWLLKHVGEKELPFRVCLYHLGIVQEFPREEKSSLQFMQDTWCASVILAAKDKVEQYLLEDRWGAKKIESVAPGIDDLPLECVGAWAKEFVQAGICVEVDSGGHMKPENSLFAAYIEIP